MAYLSAFKSPDVTFAFSFFWIRFITRFYENRPISSACSSPAFCAGEFAKHLLLHYGLLVNNNHLIVKRGANFVDATWQWCNDIYSLSATPSRWNNVLLGKRKELYDHGVGILFVLQLLCILLCSMEAGEKRSGLVWACQCIFQGSY